MTPPKPLPTDTRAGPRDTAEQRLAREAFSKWERTGKLPMTSPTVTSELLRVVGKYLPRLQRLHRQLSERERREEAA